MKISFDRAEKANLKSEFRREETEETKRETDNRERRVQKLWIYNLKFRKLERAQSDIPATRLCFALFVCTTG
jgi:hypothetical protein